ncbi:hypothetical protein METBISCDRAFT_29472 [Metschnikowia bicuspidata]|uniref:Glucosidase 2 subunit beta n=1 Tax=Metschnikowia bicuspidata TaxID=27322 RepID=A0A4P9ZHD5_9ASCO|nr:hypothetical protein METBISCDRAFT_29472 [Metschnikowia bicuspidata]
MSRLLCSLVAASVALASSVRGVAPDKQSLYQPDAQGNWKCLLDPSTVLKLEQVNDNYCDCPDGSDEPGTNACEFTSSSPKMYYCANEGFYPRYIENYKLNDGVCDYEICCDGSDEYVSGRCPNVCSKVKEQYDGYILKKKEEMNHGLIARQVLEAKAAKRKEASLKATAKLTEEVAKFEHQLKYKACEPKTEAHEEIQQLSQLIVDETKFKQLMQDYTAQYTGLSNKIAFLEKIMLEMAMNYNPNFNDAAVKTAIHFFQDYLSNKPEPQKLPTQYDHVIILKNSQGSQLVDDSIQNYIKKVIYIPQILFNYCNTIVDYFPNYAKAERKQKLIRKGLHVTNSQMDQKLIQKLQSLQRELEILNQKNMQYYGENDILRAMEQQEYEQKFGDYVYKIKFLNSIYQDNTLLGRYIGFDGTSMHFAGGDRCWNGPQRSATLGFACSEKMKISSVYEPQKCQYEILATSPLACKDFSEEELAKGFMLNKASL